MTWIKKLRWSLPGLIVLVLPAMQVPDYSGLNRRHGE